MEVFVEETEAALVCLACLFIVSRHCCHCQVELSCQRAQSGGRTNLRIGAAGVA